MRVDRKRHILKTITWRIVASVTTFIISWGTTGSIAVGLSIGTFDSILKLFLYYAHERVWYKSRFGIK